MRTYPTQMDGRILFYIKVCKDSNKRARNIKLALIFFTASAVYVRGFYFKDIHNHWNMILSILFNIITLSLKKSF